MSLSWFFIILFGGTIAAYGLFRLLFSMKSTEDIIEANAETNKDKHYIKKYPEVDIYPFSGVFSLVGLLIALSFSFFAFIWYPAVDEGDSMILTEEFLDEEIEQLPPQSQQKPPPPPPPPPPPKLEIVEDEEIIEDEPEIIDTEADEDTEFEVEEIVEEVEEVVEEVEEVVEEVEEPEIFTIVEDMPEFPGGQKKLFEFLGNNIKYPPMARENGIDGTVYVGFVVMEDGSVENVHIKRGLPGGGAGCDDEAIRVVKQMPNWKPGKQRGKPVRVAYTLPIRFRLE